ncbi:hypothetical protein PspLS_01961 [Pyricularia sp. CBS 133598]|nr:hypothetical protein PspLS_01961 [Pyricularia sp. CBS 133598]
MHTVRTFTGSPRDMLDPNFRVVGFDDESHIVTVVSHCRALWVTDPAIEETEVEGAGEQAAGNAAPNPLRFASRLQFGKGKDNYVDAPRNPDTDTIDTPWRKEIHKTFVHVFYDIMNQLPSVNCTVGHYHPPKHQVLGVPFVASQITEDGTKGEVQAAVCKKWETNMLFIPTFLAHGVTIRATVQDDEADQERELSIFNKSTEHKFELWYLRRDVTIRLYVEGDNAQNNSTAAVMVLGELRQTGRQAGDPGYRVCFQSSIYYLGEVVFSVYRSCSSQGAR